MVNFVNFKTTTTGFKWSIGTYLRLLQKNYVFKDLKEIF